MREAIRDSVCAPQQTSESVNSPRVLISSVGLLRPLVAASAINTVVAPFVRVFVLKLQLGQFFGEVTFQTLVSQFRGQMFGRGGRHRFGLVPGRQPPQTADDKNYDCYKDQIARLHFH